MLDFISLAILFVGLALASYHDIKTTEIPDLLAYLLLGSGIVIFSVYHLTSNGIDKFFENLFYPLLLTVFGFGMYLIGQWGMGDSFLLASTGFLFINNPIAKSFLTPQLDFLFNLLLLGAIYVPIKTASMFIKNRKIRKIFKKNLVENKKYLTIFLLTFPVTMAAFNFFLLGEINLSAILLSSLITISIYTLWIYLKTCEKAFVKRIPVSKLKVGDVLLESKRWDGINEKKLEEIKRSGRKYVYVKNGIAFAPVFLISLIFTLIFGNLYFLLLRLLLLLL